MNTRPVHIPRPCPALMFAATLGGIAPGFAIAETININPSKDNTLYEYVPADGDLSNALGNHFFTGETAVGELRRGVLAFDITGNVPAGSTITSVTLTLNMSKTPSNTARTVELHRLLADWEEGTSQASGRRRHGSARHSQRCHVAPSLLRYHFWTTEGGDFFGTVSASQSVGAIGSYTWSSAQMVADVQSWLDNSTINFGWLVRGDESGSATAKRFDTRESAIPRRWLSNTRHQFQARLRRLRQPQRLRQHLPPQ